MGYLTGPAGRIAALLVAVALLPGLAGPARAATGAWGRTAEVEARLVSAVDGTGPGVSVPLGLEIRLQPGWKTYWRSPGDAGLPPRLDWAGSANLAGVEMSWPAPVRFSLFGLETFGYEREVVLPLTARRRDPGQPLALRAGVDLLVCHDVCVPAHFDLALELPTGPATPAAEAELIARYVQRVPGDGAAAGLSVVAVRAWAPESGPGLEVEATAREPFANPDLFIETDSPPLVFKAPELRFRDGDRRVIARLALVPPGKAGEPVRTLAGSKLTVTLVDGGRSVEAVATVAAPVSGPAEPKLLVMLGLALLGGLVLNLMPCVLPVLSMKLLSVVKHGGGSTRAVRAGFLASAAGILFSFLLLAGTMIGLKTAGAVVGWGIQFQQPWFLAGMALVVALFAANLLGLFEIPLPRFVAEAAAADPHHPSTLAGPFVTGAFATLLATPCSAPFVGTAIGFALARGPLDILAVFVALGVGLSAPYLLVAAFPRVATMLPRPGRWMIRLRRLFGLALAVTALWLLWLLAAPRLLEPVTAVTEPSSGQISWRPFDQAEIRRQVEAGHVVLVDVTADWCLTCIANKRFVLNRPEVAGRLRDAAGAIVAMSADWTRPDAVISRYLADFGRYGIPFNAVYGPAAPDGLALPELLSVSAVLDGLAQAAGGVPVGDRR